MRRSAFTLALLSVSSAPTWARAALPDRAWGTYFGGTGHELLRAVRVDDAGNLFVCGKTGTPTGMATPGTHQQALAGNVDALIAKFTPDGARVWSTYFGGTKEDACHDLAVAPDGQLLVVGRAYSPGGIATPGALMPNLGEGGFAARFDPDGKRVWATYIGEAYAAGIDADGRYVVAGRVTMAYPFALPDAHQPVFGGGGRDAYVLALSPEGALVRGTYHGGPGPDAAYSLALTTDATYVGMQPGSPDLATPNAHQTAPAGNGDVMILRLGGGAELVWATYVGGPGDDMVAAEVDLAVGPDGGVYLASTTQSGSGIATPGAFQDVLNGATDVMLARFDADGARLWSTYYGTGNQDYFSGLAADPAGGAFVLFKTAGGNGVATPDTYQQNLAGASDYVLAKFDAAGARRFSTYYGGADNEDFTSNALAVDGLDTIYLVGGSPSPTGIASLGSFQSVLAGSSDAVIVRFHQNLGLPCADAATCGTGQCIDGVCCDAACGSSDPDDCAACSVAAGAAVDGACGPRATGLTCRLAAGPCDGAEFCDGAAFDCPADGPVVDGTPCIDGICLAGACGPEPDLTTSDATDTSTSGLDGTGGDASSSTGGLTATTSAATTSDATTSDTTTTSGPPTPGTSTGAGSTSDALTTSDTPTGGPASSPEPPTGDASSGEPGQVEPGGCGCRSDGAPTLLSAALVALSAARRRRRLV